MKGKDIDILVPGEATRVCVSRNALLSARDFDGFELNVIMHVLSRLSGYQYIGDNQKVLDDKSCFFAFSELSLRHGGKRDEFIKRLRKLKSKEISYKVETNDIPIATVFTGLFSSIIEYEGGVIAPVAKEAMPWLLNLGIGYSAIEKEIFFRMRSDYVKRLYLIVFSHMRGGEYADFSISIDNLKREIGLPEEKTLRSITSIKARCLDPYCEKMNKQSIYDVSYEVKKEKKHRRGAPKSAMITFTVLKKADFMRPLNNDGGAVVNYIQACYEYWKTSDKVRKMPLIIKDVYDSGKTEYFCDIVEPYFKKYGKGPHFANTIKLILKDRFGIEVLEE